MWPHTSDDGAPCPGIPTLSRTVVSALARTALGPSSRRGRISAVLRIARSIASVSAPELDMSGRAYCVGHPAVYRRRARQPRAVFPPPFQNGTDTGEESGRQPASDLGKPGEEHRTHGRL